MDPEISKMHYVKMAELWKIDDLADQVAEFQPKPNPMQEELMALQLEEQKLKNAILMKQLESEDSKIAERISRSSENLESDIELKQAKAAQALAVAEKVQSETDLLDSQFLRIESGQERREAIEDSEYRANTDAALKQLDKSIANIPAKTVAEI